MAQVARYTNKDPITNGTTSDKLNLEDKLPLQHTKGDNADKYASLLAITATPYGTTGTGASTATKNVTLSNYPADFTAIVGTKVRVKFTNANTAATQMYLKIGSLAAKPATCRGFPMTAGSVLAGSEIEFMYNGTSWDCQLCEAISTADASSKSPINSSALNGALAPSITVISGGGAFLTNIGKLYFLTFDGGNTEFTSFSLGFNVSRVTRAPMLYYDGSTHKNGFIVVSTNGTVKMYNQGGTEITANYVRGQVMFTSA